MTSHILFQDRGKSNQDRGNRDHSGFVFKKFSAGDGIDGEHKK